VSQRPLGCFLFVATLWLSAPATRAASFTLVGTHPDAAAQPSATGKRLATLHPFNGKLYAGYGDYDINSGPISIRPFNPATNTFGASLQSSTTEAIYIYRRLNGKLYGPHIDTRGTSGGYSQGTASGAAESWFNSTQPVTTHAYDMATLDGSDLWVVGSRINNAVAWRSTNGGTSWTNVLSVAPINTSSFSRFYGAGVYNSKLYVQAVDAVGGAHPNSKVFDGTTWTNGPSLLPNGGFVWHPESFSGKLVYQTFHAGWVATPLYQFDGVSALLAPAPAAMYDFIVAGDKLFALGLDHLIYETADLSSFIPIATAPITARSLAILDNRLYVGGSDSSIHLYSEPIPEPHGLFLVAVVVLVFARRPAVR
jgi:hypothetical protein